MYFLKKFLVCGRIVGVGGGAVISMEATCGVLGQPLLSGVQLALGVS